MSAREMVTVIRSVPSIDKHMLSFGKPVAENGALTIRTERVKSPRFVVRGTKEQGICERRIFK